MASMGNAPKLILRIVQAVLALIAFSASAYMQSRGERAPKINFMVFTGVTAWLLAMLYAAVHCVERLQRPLWGVVEVALNSIWVVFWLAASAAYAAFPECKASQAEFRTFNECNAFLASQAFGWMSLILWIPSLALSILDMKRGEGVTGGGGGY
ncbi:MAG: marvel domain-containing protein [Monoraphidium minutum]|nr:MAG: marvel domain-containing protein [Monoraphidium minutum]